MVRGRRVLGGVIVGAAVVVVSSGAFGWREIVIRWRIAELGRQHADDELPLDYVTAEPGTIRGNALARYVRTATGKDRLLREYLAHLEDRGPLARNLGMGAGSDMAVLLFRVDATGYDAMGATVSGLGAHGTLESGTNPRPVLVPPQNLTLLWAMVFEYPTPRLHDLVLEVGYDQHPIPGRPGVTFSVVSCAVAEKRCRRHFAWDFPWGSYACLIESDPYRLDPSS
jgi:hypothetical protein